MSASPRLSELIAIHRFPAVVSGDDIAAYRSDPDSPAAHDFLAGYLGLDARSQHALQSALSCLALSQNGGAFWLSGVFGSGKSHLLGVLSLLGEGHGLAVFARSHPECASHLQKFAPRLVVHVALDEWDAAQVGLEEVFWRAAAREWARRGFGELPIERDGARIEAMSALQCEIQARGLAGLVVCFDELSLFLGGRAHGPLQGDAAWLQFLGNQSRRAPLWVFCALQKTVDDISGLERYSLSQIRDRFTLLPLSLTNVPALVRQRLVRARDETELRRWCDQTFAALSERAPRLPFGPDEWRDAFPFHPATLDLLEAVAGRFFSRTRSAALFCARAVSPESDAATRIAPDRVWDYFAPELEAHPDLRPLETIWRAWDDAASEIFPEKDRENGRRAAKWLLCAKIAGWSPTPWQLALSLDFGASLAGDGAADYARFLLERLRQRGAYLAVERGENGYLDRYTVDLGRRVSEMARRQVSAALETLPPGDARVTAHVLSGCRGAVPLGELESGRTFALWWQSAPRRLRVEVWDGTAPHLLANRAAQTRESGAEADAILAIWPPFGRDDAPFSDLFARLPADAPHALWCWKPRPPARDEWDLAREAAAAALAARDPSLGDNRRGRALLEHLAREAPARDAQLSRVALRLLLEGEVLLGSGAVLEASELARGDDFTALLEAVGDFAWPHLFPRFVTVAPRARLLSASNADTLCLEILRRAPQEPFFAPSLERLARHVGEPLGVAKSSAGRWKIAGGKAALVAELRDFLGEGAPYAALEAHFSKSALGLTPEQCAVVTCALLRGGDWAALDAQGHELAPSKIGLPLRRAVHRLRPGRLPDAAQWAKIAVLARELCALNLGAPAFDAAQGAADALAQWRELAAQDADLARARAAQLRRVAQNNAAWPTFEDASAALGAVTEALAPRGGAFERLERAAALDFAAHRDELARFRRFQSALETQTAPLLALGALLHHPELVTPPELASARLTLLERLGAGEAALFDAALLPDGAAFTQTYAARYAAWHGAQHEAARWNSWRALAQSDAMRALERLATLENRRFETGRALVGAELEKRCARDGALSGGEAVCSSCGLRLGARVPVADPRPVALALQTELESLRHALACDAARAALERRAPAFLDWDGDAATLLPLLSGAQLRALDECLAPRRRVVRSGAALLESLRRGATRRETEAAFKTWLDGEDGLSDGDEIEWQD